MEAASTLFNSISNFGWCVILIIFAMIIGALIFFATIVAKALKTKDIKTKYFETVEKNSKAAEKELFMAEGKDQLDNQCHVAKNILKELRIKLYETGLKKFGIKEKNETSILELITHRIIDRLNYDVKNDLTRNHIARKNNYDLEQYTRAKARGYFSMIKDRFYTLNEYLPSYNLPGIMDEISIMEVETLFKDVYFSARRIAGQLKEGEGK